MAALKKTKRGRGEGSIFYQTARRRWAAAVSQPGGKRQYFYAATRKEAAQRLAQALKRQDTGLGPALGKRPLATFLRLWLEQSVKTNVRPWTYHGYEAVVRVHIIPYLGHVDLQELRAQHVQELINRKITEGLSAKTVQSIRGVLRTALNEAMRWELVSRNVAALVRPPHAERKPIMPFTPDEARTLLYAAQSDRLGALYSVALAMGLRQGEALGLSWEHIDFDAGVIRVDRQLQREFGELRLVPLKTRQSQCTLPCQTRSPTR